MIPSIDRGQIDIGHICPLMAEQARDLIFGIQRAFALLDQGGVNFRCVGVTQPVERHGTVRVGILNLSSVIADELLQTIHGVIRIHIVWNEQFMASFRACQLLPEGDGNRLVDGNSANFAAFALDRNGTFAKSVFCRGGVQTETFVEPQAGITGQVKCQDVIIAILCQGLPEHSIEFFLAPGTVDVAEAAALKLYSQLIVGGQGVLCVADLIMEKADGGQVGFDGAGGFAVLLHSEDVGGQVLAADVGKFLQVELISQEVAEALHGFVVPPFGLKASLTVVLGKFIQLVEQGLIVAFGSGMHSHRYLPFDVEPHMDAVHPLATFVVSACFPDADQKKTWSKSTEPLVAQGLQRLDIPSDRNCLF